MLKSPKTWGPSRLGEVRVKATLGPGAREGREGVGDWRGSISG